jgi:5-methylcytosine-specific restriction endonuclease McrA
MRDVIVPVSREVVHPGEPTATSLAASSSSAMAVHPGEPTAPESLPLAPVEATIEPLSSQLHRIHFTASEAFIQKLEAVKEALARDFPEGDLESIFEAGLDALLTKAAKRTAQTERPRKAPEACNIATPHVADPIRRAVYQRDAHQCQWPLHSGQICGEKRFLELDHIIPLARGGPSSLKNLRVLCRVHNQEAARHAFGDAFMQRFRHSPQESTAPR